MLEQRVVPWLLGFGSSRLVVSAGFRAFAIRTMGLGSRANIRVGFVVTLRCCAALRCGLMAW